MWLANLSIRAPVFISMITAAVITVGAISYSRLGVDLFPDVSYPLVAVTVAMPGASPGEVETLISKPLEEALGSINGVKTIRSTSAEGLATIIVEFDFSHSAKEGSEDVRERMAFVSNTLPDDALDPVILRFDPSLAPILSFTVSDNSGSLTLQDLREMTEDIVKPRIEQVKGVAAAQMVGGLERQINVELDINAIKARNIPAERVVAALKAENSELPGGRLSSSQEELLIRTSGQFHDIDQIRQVVLGSNNGNPIYLKDAGTITDGFKEVRSLSRLNGQDSLSVAVQKQSGANTVNVAEAVRREITRLMASNPALNIVVIRDESRFIKDSSQDVTLAIIVGGIFASMVVFLFFRDLRNTIITVAGLPVILLGTFTAMHLLGFTLNMITLMALALCIGLLIDDAIVVRENIFRHMERGERPMEAAGRGTGEIAFAVIAMTFTIVAVFLPVAFVSGFIGIFFRQFGLTVVVAVIISLVEAFTIAPMLSAHFLKPIDYNDITIVRRRGLLTKVVDMYKVLENSYGAVLGWALRHRKATVVAGVGVLIGSVALVGLVGTTFTQTPDQGEFIMSLELPPGTTLEETDHSVRHIESVLSQQPEVAAVFITIGSDEGSPDKAEIFVKLRKRGVTEDVQDRMRVLLQDVRVLTFSGETFNVGSGRMGTASNAVRGRPIQLQIKGDIPLEELDLISQEVADSMAQVPGVVDLDRSYKPGKPEARIIIDRERVADLGLNVVSIATTVRTLVNGQVASKLRDGDDEIDILVRLKEQQRTGVAAIGDLPVASLSGLQVPLSSVTTIEPFTGPTVIERENRQRQITVGSNVMGRPQGSVVKDIKAALGDLTLPQGVVVDFTGQTQRSAESFRGLLTALVMAVAFVYMVLASQFGSFLHPFTIMLSLPLSMSGALLALIITDKPLDIMAMIGIIMLMGLVTKNAILLLDFIIRLRADGLNRTSAILMAGPVRLRPILMTTIAMIFGMLPTATGLGAGAEFRAPMAITVIGGLITSTLLTLIIVPVVYTLLDDLQTFLQRGTPGAEEHVTTSVYDLPRAGRTS